MNKYLPIQTSEISINHILIIPAKSIGNPNSVRILRITDSLIQLYTINGDIQGKQNVIRFCACYNR
jgi:hypothetical protein